MAQSIMAYKPVCCNKPYMRKSSAIRHEKKCPKNPENKACQTCKHRTKESETIYNPHHNGNPGSADFDVKYWWCEIYEKEITICSNGDKTIPPRMNCEHWSEQERGVGE